MSATETVRVTVSAEHVARLSYGDRRDGKPAVTVQEAVQQIVDNYFVQRTDGAGGAIG